MSESTDPETMERRATDGLADGGDETAEADLVRRDAGVRLRTNIQAGRASERVNVTGEVHARDMGDLALKLPSYRQVLGEQVEWARERAKEVNEE